MLPPVTSSDFWAEFPVWSEFNGGDKGQKLAKVTGLEQKPSESWNNFLLLQTSPAPFVILSLMPGLTCQK
jgi:hypothetical protein